MSSPLPAPALPHRHEVHVLISCYGPMRPPTCVSGGGIVPAGAAAAPLPRWWSSRVSNLRLDEHVTRDAGRGDAVAAVPDEERLARTRQADRRWLAALLEPCAIALDLGAVETTVAEADVRERDPCRCERRMCDTPPFSRSIRVRTGGVEPPQPLATRLQRAELAGARRPQGETRRPIGLEPTQRGSRPRMLAVTSRPPGEMEGGIGSPQPEAEALPFRSAPEPAVTHRRPCQRVSAPPPPHRSALEACRSQLHVRAHALRSPCSVTSSTRPSTGRSSNLE